MANIQYVDGSVPLTDELFADESLLNAMRIDAMRSAIKSIGCIPEPQTSVHLKGFASGLADLTEAQLSEVVDILVKEIRKNNISTLFWDGDDYATDSFTSVLPSLQKRLPEVQFIAFLMAHEKHTRWSNDKGFNGSWDNVLQNLHVITTDSKLASGDRYDRLGALALQATQAKLVIAIGGGQVIRQEYDENRAVVGRGGDDVRFVLFNAVRHEAGSVQLSSLYELEGVELSEMPAKKFGAEQHPWTATTDARE